MGWKPADFTELQKTLDELKVATDLALQEDLKRLENLNRILDTQHKMTEKANNSGLEEIRRSSTDIQ